jgi:hypothetical protein
VATRGHDEVGHWFETRTPRVGDRVLGAAAPGGEQRGTVIGRTPWRLPYNCATAVG